MTYEYYDYDYHDHYDYEYHSDYDICVRSLPMIQDDLSVIDDCWLMSTNS